MKNNKGVTLVALILAIVLILIIGGMMGYYTTSGLDLQKVNNLYSDIDQIQNKVDEYYLKNSSLPLYSQVGQVSFSNSKNVNDNENYYVIDLSVLGNLRLNYGSDFETVKINNSLGNKRDIYIINEQSQTIYYLDGIEYENKDYYTKPIEYTQIQ